MIGKNHKIERKRKRTKKTSLLPFLVPLVILILGAGIYLILGKAEINNTALQIVSKLQKKIPLLSNKYELSEATTPRQESAPTEIVTPKTTPQGSPKNPYQEAELEQSSPLMQEVKNDIIVMFDDPDSARLASEMSSKDDLCSNSAQVVNEFYTHLDQQPYIKSFQINNTSSSHFTDLIQKLLDNPPVVSRETDDLFTILRNTAHFFRIIGKKNIIILKGILDREKDYFENVLRNFYTLTTLPQCPQRSFNISITKEALYDYAGFFLNTMGGRLYLFRRDSVSRMTVNYYAILIIDQANVEDNNKYGIQLQPAIDSLIPEIEASSSQLKLKDSYLETLYDLKEKYQSMY